MFEDEAQWMMKKLLTWRTGHIDQKIMKRSCLSLESNRLKNLLQRKMEAGANMAQPRMFVFAVSGLGIITVWLIPNYTAWR